jgi:uncharacterized protein YsxB (DUF464 family)
MIRDKAEIEMLTSQLCNVTNPFCETAAGAVSPYGASTFTFPYTNRTVGSFSTGASGEGYILVSATPNANNLIISPEATTTWGSRTGFNAPVGAAPAFIAEARVVSAGVRWWPINAMTSARGTVVVTPIPDTAVFFGSTRNLNEMINSAQVSVVSIDTESAYVMGPQSPDARDFIPVGSPTNSKNTGFDAVCIAVTGAASTTYLGFEVIINYEGLIDATASFIGGAQPSPKPLAQSFFEAAQKWSGYAEGTVKFLDKIARSRAAQFVRQQMFNYVPGGRIANIAYAAIKDVD